MELRQEIQNLILQTKEAILTKKILSARNISAAEKISDKEWVMKFYSQDRFCLETPENEHTITFTIVDNVIIPSVDDREVEWNTHTYAGLIYLEDTLKYLNIRTTRQKVHSRRDDRTGHS